jgi:hypothetical protein
VGSSRKDTKSTKHFDVASGNTPVSKETVINIVKEALTHFNDLMRLKLVDFSQFENNPEIMHCLNQLKRVAKGDLSEPTEKSILDDIIKKARTNVSLREALIRIGKIPEEQEGYTEMVYEANIKSENKKIAHSFITGMSDEMRTSLVTFGLTQERKSSIFEKVQELAKKYHPSDKNVQRQITYFAEDFLNEQVPTNDGRSELDNISDFDLNA